MDFASQISAFEKKKEQKKTNKFIQTAFKSYTTWSQVGTSSLQTILAQP